jgi:Protein of unknown function (DUF2946)
MAALALLLMSLAPTVSHALQGRNAKDWVQVCSTQGAQSISAFADAEGRSSAPQPAAEHPFEHCPYCSLQAGTVGLPAASIAVVLLALRDQAPRLFFTAPRTLHVWLAARPRGPPRLV